MGTGTSHGLNCILNVLGRYQASRRSLHSFPPYFSLVFWFKGDEGTDLAFVNWLDFTRGIKLVPVGTNFALLYRLAAQIDRHLGPAYQVARITLPHPPPHIAVLIKGFELFPVEPLLPDVGDGSGDLPRPVKLSEMKIRVESVRSI